MSDHHPLVKALGKPDADAAGVASGHDGNSAWHPGLAYADRQ